MTSAVYIFETARSQDICEDEEFDNSCGDDTTLDPEPATNLLMEGSQEDRTYKTLLTSNVFSYAACVSAWGPM